jgi:hypothetical protein
MATARYGWRVNNILLNESKKPGTLSSGMILKGYQRSVCPTCLIDRLVIPHPSPVKTREMITREIQSKHPQMLGLKLLWHTAGIASISVMCDLCQGDCMDRHLKIKSSWLTEQGEELIAELCSQCISERLQPTVRFQVKPPKQQPIEVSDG